MLKFEAPSSGLPEWYKEFQKNVECFIPFSPLLKYNLASFRQCTKGYCKDHNQSERETYLVFKKLL